MDDNLTIIALADENNILNAKNEALKHNLDALEAGKEKTGFDYLKGRYDGD